MAVTLLIPTALRQFTGGLSDVILEAKTAGEALNRLAEEYPDLQKHIFTDNKTLRSFINVYVNEEDIRQKLGTETPLAEGDSVMLVPSIAGGSFEGEGDADIINPLPELTNKEIARYSRHLILPEVGMDGQRKLKNSRVLIVGTGGLGAPLLMYLSAAGIGTLGVLDFDVVEESNLQRQIIHGTRDIGRPKVASAKDRIKNINPNVNVETYDTMLTSGNAMQILKDYDVVVDGTDNFATRYLVNDACVLLGKPNVYGSIFRFEGQASVFYAEKGACYRCLYSEPPPPGLVPSCAEGGVLGVLPGIVGCIQANETIKLLIGGGEPLINRLLLFDAWKMRFRELKLAKDPKCPICGENPSIKELIDYEEFCGVKNPGSEDVPVDEITAVELKRRFDNNDIPLIIDVREPHEQAIAKLPHTKIVPLGQVVRRQSEFDPARDTVIVCRIGQKSGFAIKALRESGYTGPLYNLKDGITAWANEVDTAMPRY